LATARKRWTRVNDTVGRAMSLNIRWALVVTSAFVAAILISESAAAEERATAAPAAAAVASKSDTTALKRLDLRTPDVTHLFTEQQINKVLATTFRENIEEVEVEGERDIPSTPRVWPGIFAPFWALANPTQAWRIIAPLPPDQTRGMQFARSDATDRYLLDPAGTIQLDY
jgi:hypothetical protein